MSAAYCARRFPAPAVVFAATVAIYSLAITAFLARNQTSVGALIHVGPHFAHGLRIESGIPVCRSGDGYDGQFFYRLALQPCYSDTTIGPRLDDAAYRHQRILYPLVVWALSLGQAGPVRWMLVVVNVAALGLIGALGAVFAAGERRPPWWGLCFSLYPGFVFSLLHDLPEPLSICLLLGAVMLVRRGRQLWATVVFSLAALTRETTALAPFALLCVWALQSVHRPGADTRIRWYVGTVPLALLSALNIALKLKYGLFPFEQGGGNFTYPFLGYIEKVAAVLLNPGSINAVFDLFLIAALFITSGYAIVNARTGQFHEKAVFWAYLLFACFFSEWILAYRGGLLRAASELYLVSCMAMLGSGAKHARLCVLSWLVLSFLTCLGYVLSNKLVFG